MRTVLLQSYYLSNDCGAVSKMLELQATETRQRKRRPRRSCRSSPTATCKQKDNGGYVYAIEKLVIYYPKKEYWIDLLAACRGSPASPTASRSTSIACARHRQHGTANDYMEMAQLALQAGIPAEAKTVVDKGYAAACSARARRPSARSACATWSHKTLDDSQQEPRAQDEAEAQASKDGNDLVKVGLNYVYEGKADKGLALIEQGIKRGGLQPPRRRQAAPTARPSSTPARSSAACRRCAR